jgi:hydrogenase/urease accessory protein HupE
VLSPLPALPSCSALRDRLTVPGLAVAASLFPQSALAHSPFPGAEGFYTGLLHPLISFDQLLVLLALGVMFGLGTQKWIAISFAAFAILASGGIVSGLFGYLPPETSPWLLFVAFVSAATAAIYPSGLFATLVSLSALGGVLIGLSSIPDPGPLRDMVITSAGSFVGANYILIMVGGSVSWFRMRFDRDWSLIGARIVAAWIATISVSMAALALASR